MNDNAPSPEFSSTSVRPSCLQMASIWVVVVSLIIFFSIQLAVSVSTNSRLAEALTAQEKATSDFVESNGRVIQESQVILTTLETLARELVALQNESATAKRIVQDLGITIQNRSNANTGGAQPTPAPDTPQPNP